MRLNSRSPKDATYPGLPVTCSGKQAVYWLGGSERVLDDVVMIRGARKPIFICLREVRLLHKDGEFRCFARDGKMLAVSRYFFADPPQSALQPDEHIWDAAVSFYDKHLGTHYPDVVFDLYAPGSAQELLIEINPYGMSHPCMFSGYGEIEEIGGVRQRATETPE